MKDALIKFISGFNAFSQEEIIAVAEKMKVETFKKSTVILREGDVSSKCYFVLSGCVRQYILVDGEEKTTGFFTEGQAAILYASYMNKLPSAYYLSCVEDSTLTTGTREEEEALHTEYPKLKYLVHTVMPQDYANMQERLAAMMNSTAEERYLMLLQTQPELLTRVPLHQLASYIGVTPESFSRIRKRILLKDKSIN
ncbi:Crp/Fnr family transcriptional regulator [Cytophaga hutchinsonii]|jgi:CRP-like cAMP-binding protein|uniref:Cyclic nucleotide binding regulatory protein n=1 Tax=Cytophaga hutchinsonii (strain ATCC 33406 / DSM 1761 / CIP 103989 / NBRC 15051 / NCIMB 9469 / D465) TaxID=269798 RepID=A0A6N4SQ30_CYTH3|nr:Crp/Fnr family transcriptional regulator [Cytophaga hutchinsonii]ABG58391.1 cyclic nucleotide binding regulatory protein [Cytophaga hutchinsonii ATCC 33406]SFX51120.1 cAMP-binding domain of CRP or a regulatory subunit of cAMP-dependent protein kinases [Cytophaga hutchinsonii ATCC 33406]